MECNIGAAGKAARLKLGIAAVLGGLVLAGIILSGLLDGTIWWLGVAGQSLVALSQYGKRELVGVS